MIFGRQKLNVVARDMIRDRTALRLVFGFVWRELHLGCHGRLGHFARFKRQHELLGLFRRQSIAPGLWPGDLMAKLLNGHGLGFDLGQKLGRELFEFPVILRQCHCFSHHGQSFHHWKD